MEEMFVVKRDGTKQRFSVDKIRNRLEQLCHGLDKKVRVTTPHQQLLAASAVIVSFNSTPFPIFRCCRMMWFCREFVKVFLGG